MWQLIDSAFPTGGFAHSNGLEAAWQNGEVPDRQELIGFVEASLDQAGRGSLPLVLAAFDVPKKLIELDRLTEAFMSNHVANRASRAQGRALLAAMERLFEIPQPIRARPPYAHLAPVWGVCLRRLRVPRLTAGRMFMFNHLRSLLAAAVRLNIVGPMEAQALTRRLHARAETVLQGGKDLGPDDIAQTAPLIDLWQGTQDGLYSRLFQS